MGGIELSSMMKGVHEPLLLQAKDFLLQCIEKCDNKRESVFPWMRNHAYINEHTLLFSLIHRILIVQRIC